jgi:site-specific DNA-methyltransferase (adenine-specific)
MATTLREHREERNGDRSASRVLETEAIYDPTTEDLPPDPASTVVGSVQIELIDAAKRYAVWPAPTVIVSDGPYGLSRFPGDPPTADGLAEWYAPHISAWSRYSLPETTLWFWSSEVGWATVHPVLKLLGWQYRACHVWDKGIGHIAGNVNSKTIRGFPVVTEVCVQYVRDVHLPAEDGEPVPMRVWLRREWQRAGLPLALTNQVCGVKNAATRKYFTQDHLWYFPPPDMMERLAAYANCYGRTAGRPYFSLDGKTPVTANQWVRMRAKWNHSHGVTNVWSEPAVRGEERLKDGQTKCLHANQKPLRLIERIVRASSDPGDVVWEPFGGLCSVAVGALRTNRRCYSAEINPRFYQVARARLLTARQEELFGEPAAAAS